MDDGLRALNELEGESFGAGVAGEQEGYMAAEASYEGDGFDTFDGEDRYALAAEYLGEGEGEFEAEFEGEVYETGVPESVYEYEGEGEGDEFFGKIWRAAKVAANAVAPLAKQFAPQIGTVIGGALGGPAGAMLGRSLGSAAQNMESEDEGESEDEMNAGEPATPELEGAIAELLALAAARGRPVEAQSLGSQITLLIGTGAPVRVRRLLPVLGQASGNVARVLVARRDPRSRALVRALPTIQRRTIATLTRKAQAGRAVTPRVAVRVMAKHAQRTLGSPQAITRALAQNAARRRKLDRGAIRRSERTH